MNKNLKSHLVERTNGVLKLVESAKLRKGCIGRLEGPCADFLNPTRNDRLYGLQLWKNVFSNDLVLESIRTKTAFGELDHPEDRFEVLSKLACVVMTDFNINEDEGVVEGGFDILDTPQGKILKSLLDYGCQMGVSSRGTGDIIQTENGEEVDPDTYEFACFDVVSTPAVAKARQTYTESIKQDRKKKALTESIKSEINNCNSEIELNAIQNTIKNAKVPNLHSLTECIEDRKSSLTKEGKTISKSNDSNNAVKSKSNKFDKTIMENVDVSDFKRLSRTVSELNSKVNAFKLRENHLNKMNLNYKQQIEQLTSDLQRAKEQLKECRTYKKDIVKYKRLSESLKKDNFTLRQTNEAINNKLVRAKDDVSQIRQLNEQLNQLQSENNNLSETIDNLNEQLNESTSIINSYKDKQQVLKNKLKEQNYTNAKLDETIELNRTIKNDNNDLLSQIDSLEEQLKLSENDVNSYKSKYDRLLENYNRLKTINNSYKSTYLQEYANKQGINPDTVKHLIKESSSPKDIKKVVDDIRNKQDRYSKLPISYEEPTTLNVLKENINSSKEDDDYNNTLKFLTAVQNSL